MSPVRCPYCQFELELKGMRPGRFKPSCPQCHERFILMVPAQPHKNPIASRLSKNKLSRRESFPGRRPRVSRSMGIPEIRGRVGGYQVRQKLGEGENGAVYLARQVSLDRSVALKVLSPELASNAVHCGWLMRQAYAAAQLRHDNLVQMYDLGVQHTTGGDLPFFASEFVEGQTLAELIRQSPGMEAETAVGYVLQAARGLKFAHDHGLLHRNIKPSNLLLDDRGRVKVADLGLTGRTASTHTPHAPPEGGDKGAEMDGRADIFSLGCTLYEMLTGQPPVHGNSANEAIARAENVPLPILFIVMKMMSMRPMDRYPGMGDVIAALENSLGLGPGKSFPGTPGQVHALQQAVERFNSSPWNRWRSVCIWGFFLLWLISIIVLSMPRFGHPAFAAAGVGFVLAVIIVYQILLGLSQRTSPVLEFRELIFDGSPWHGLIALSFAAIGIGLLTAFDLQWVFLILTTAALVVAATFLSTIDALLAKDRSTALMQTHQILKEIRLRGNDENALHQFICRHAGRNWEEFYEAIFGFDAKLLARQTWGEGKRGRLRVKYGRWREPIIAWLEGKIRLRQQNRRRTLFTRLERKALLAKGMETKSANSTARANARRIVEKGEVIHQTSILRGAEAALPPHARAAIQFNAQVRAISGDWIQDDSREADEHDTDRYRGNVHRRLVQPIEILLGPSVRLIVSLVILGGFVLWRNAGNLNMPFHPFRGWIGADFGSWNAGLVGILLLISTLYSGKALGLLVLLAAVAGLFWHRVDVPILGDEHWTASVAALGLWIMGISLRIRPEI